LYNDQVSYPWFPPAGLNRGSVNNLSDIGYLNADGGWVHNAIDNGLRDALFTLKINPLTQLPASGIAVWGQLTRSAVTSARDRVNVVRLENYLRTIFQSIANGYLFEPNDSITRKSIAAAIAGSLNTILAHRGLYDFLVVCDESNNTTDTIANSQLWVDVAIEPMRGVEFIYIPIGIYNPGQIKALGV
jgi:phage tail sheath protein FI